MRRLTKAYRGQVWAPGCVDSHRRGTRPIDSRREGAAQNTAVRRLKVLRMGRCRDRSSPPRDIHLGTGARPRATPPFVMSPFELTVRLLEGLQLVHGLARANPRHVALVDVGLLHLGPQRRRAVAELHRDALHRDALRRAVRGAQLGTQRPDHPHHSSLLLRAIDA